MKKFEAYIDENKFGDMIPENWEAAAEYLNSLIDDLDEDENGEIDRDEVDAIWEAYCHGDYDKDMAENANAEQLAAMIRDRDTWDADMLRMLCEKAGMLEAWEAADGDTFETVAFAAAEKLGVDIIGGGSVDLCELTRQESGIVWYPDDTVFVGNWCDVTIDAGLVSREHYDRFDDRANISGAREVIDDNGDLRNGTGIADDGTVYELTDGTLIFAPNGWN